MNEYSRQETMGKVKRAEYKCTVCSKTFYYKNDLTNHLLKHANEKKYGCDTCDRQFISTKSLKRHQKFECLTEIKCPVCDKTLRKGVKKLFCWYIGLSFK